jgi:hypothetical protein
MYFGYVRIGSDPASANLFSLTIGVLGALTGYLASQASNVKSQAQLDRILGASLIREKEAEAKTVEEAKALYESELQNLKTIIEREGNQLLLKRLRSVYVDDLKEKLREVESIESELQIIEHQATTPEVDGIRLRLEGLLKNVRNPEEDDRLIREFCYSVPLIGNTLYFIYSVWKKVDPSVQDRVHHRLNSLARGAGDSRPIARVGAILVIAFFAIGVLAVFVSIYRHL